MTVFEVVLEENKRLKADKLKLESAIRQAIWRIERLNTGGPDEPDPTVARLKAALGANKAKS